MSRLEIFAYTYHIVENNIFRQFQWKLKSSLEFCLASFCWGGGRYLRQSLQSLKTMYMVTEQETKWENMLGGFFCHLSEVTF